MLMFCDFCPFGSRTAKRLKQDYLLSSFPPAWLQHLLAQLQQNQEPLPLIQGLDIREQVWQESLFNKKFNHKCVAFLATQAE
jgi:hypothetical protein